MVEAEGTPVPPEGHLAARMDRMGTEAAFRVFARAQALEAQGRDIVHLEMGQADMPTPAFIVEATKRALDEGHTGYAPAAGLPELRAAIAEHVTETRGWQVPASQVVVCPGGKPVIYFTYMALVEAGDEVIYPDPGFPIFESMCDALGAVRRPYFPGSGSGTRPDLDHIASLFSDRTKLVVVNSPSNPTGVVYTREELAHIAELAKRHDAIVLSDEIYSHILFAGKHESIATFPGMAERTVLLDGFSKTWCMTGYRLGYAVGPQPIIDAIEKLMTNSNSCAVNFAQHAGLAALAGPRDCVHEMVARFRERRDVLVAGLSKLPGVTCDLPDGSFFVFADIRETGIPSRVMADRLLEEAGVACVEGPAFGEGGEGYLRFSIAASVERIEEAVQRIGTFLATQRGAAS